MTSGLPVEILAWGGHIGGGTRVRWLYDTISDYDFARIREGLVVVAVVETNFKVKLQPKLNKKSQTKEIIH